VRIVSTELPDVLLIEPDVLRDSRGFFLETYHAAKYRSAGIMMPFVQDNRSRSVRGTIRGLHLQVERPQAKLVQVVLGEIYDVAVDVRRGSPTFGRFVALHLSAGACRQLYIPHGFAHGFAVTSETADVEYKCTEIYDPSAEVGIAWDDPALAIPWPVAQPILSDRDRNNPKLAEIGGRLPAFAALHSTTDL
jgi:dTDP-4-dehydrorhamnose 3,5-epimerase